MGSETSSIRELRTDFRLVKRKVEQHGEIIITDNGVPAYVLKSLPFKVEKSAAVPNYYARLVKRQPKPLSREESHSLWKEERGDR